MKKLNLKKKDAHGKEVTYTINIPDHNDSIVNVQQVYDSSVTSTSGSL